MVKPAVEKLPLAARKGLKDTWDAEKASYDEKLSTILKAPWQFTFDPALVYANCQREDLLNRLGDAIGWYADAFNDNIARWLERVAGSSGLADINRLVPKRTVTIAPQTDTKFDYGGVVIKDGGIIIVFAENSLGSNVDQVSDPKAINKAVNEAASEADAGTTSLTPDARRDIEKNYDAEIESVRASIGKLVGIPDITLEPNFEANAAKVKTSNKADRLESIGQASFDYFSAVQKAIDGQKFGGDEMLQEGFADAISSKKISLRVVDALKKKTYNEATIENGTLYIDVTTATWWANVDEAGAGLIDLL